jgi:pimeloyl-ACP methyl ester carboxylesterase
MKTAKKKITALVALAAVATTAWMMPAAPASAAPSSPVILFPGIGGSQLWGIPNGYNNDSGNGSDIVWVDKAADHFSLDVLVNDAELAYNLELKHNSTTNPTDVGPTHTDVRVWPLLDNYGLAGIQHLDADNWDVTAYFNHMIDRFYADGYVPGKTLFGFPYDWRQDYEKSFDRITQTINQALAASGASSVDIVAHSQGGMLMKSYLIAHPEMAPKINHYVTMGTPFLGAALAARATSSKLGGYNFSLSGLVDNSTGYTIAKTSPAVYHLAPSYRYEQLMFSTYGRGTINSASNPAYTPTTPSQGYYTQLRNFETDKALFDYSSQKHTAWDTAAPSVQRYHIVSDSVSTETAYNYSYCSSCWFSDPNQVDYIMKAGDGTVPLISAQNPGTAGAPIYYVHSGSQGATVDHMGLVKDDNVISKVISILHGYPDAPVAGIDTTPNTALNNKTLTAYSLTAAPQDLNGTFSVTDSAGRIEKITFREGKYISEGAKSGVIVRTGEVTDEQTGKQLLNVQLMLPSEQASDIEFTAADDANISLRTYQTGAAGITNKQDLGQYTHNQKQSQKQSLKIKHRDGKANILR